MTNKSVCIDFHIEMTLKIILKALIFDGYLKCQKYFEKFTKFHSFIKINDTETIIL